MEVCAKKTLIVLGSGGHTSEMMRLVTALDKKKYNPRVYLVALTDPRSAEKALEYERPRRDSVVHEGGENRVTSLSPGKLEDEIKYGDLKKRRVSVYGSLHTPDYSILLTPRAREVGQSYISAVFSTLYVLFWCIPFLLRERPEVILANGPGTCLPVCCVAWLMRLFRLLTCRITFIESICRVKSLSLSGKLLRWFTDDVIVQWPELKDIYPSRLSESQAVTNNLGCELVFRHNGNQSLNNSSIFNPDKYLDTNLSQKGDHHIQSYHSFVNHHSFNFRIFEIDMAFIPKIGLQVIGLQVFRGLHLEKPCSRKTIKKVTHVNTLQNGRKNAFGLGLNMYHQFKVGPFDEGLQNVRIFKDTSEILESRRVDQEPQAGADFEHNIHRLKLQEWRQRGNEIMFENSPALDSSFQININKMVVQPRLQFLRVYANNYITNTSSSSLAFYLTEVDDEILCWRTNSTCSRSKWPQNCSQVRFATFESNDDGRLAHVMVQTFLLYSFMRDYHDKRRTRARDDDSRTTAVVHMLPIVPEAKAQLLNTVFSGWDDDDLVETRRLFAKCRRANPWVLVHMNQQEPIITGHNNNVWLETWPTDELGLVRNWDIFTRLFALREQVAREADNWLRVNSIITTKKEEEQKTVTPAQSSPLKQQQQKDPYLIGIHIRRTDYLPHVRRLIVANHDSNSSYNIQSQNKLKHGDDDGYPSGPQIWAAVHHLLRTHFTKSNREKITGQQQPHQRVVVLVVTDDPEWCRKNLMTTGDDDRSTNNRSSWHKNFQIRSVLVDTGRWDVDFALLTRTQASIVTFGAFGLLASLLATPHHQFQQQLDLMRNIILHKSTFPISTVMGDGDDRRLLYRLVPTMCHWSHLVVAGRDRLPGVVFVPYLSNTGISKERKKKSHRSPNHFFTHCPQINKIRSAVGNSAAIRNSGKPLHSGKENRPSKVKERLTCDHTSSVNGKEL
ncbi:unnamed protein product [Notodromas monacha]|uniref:UDP-N-acetylglucosamine transferase subunit ALG14 n=1 Tax=Notodromas monacha TaxID=399045 RepID=A0A7R9GEY0_9CRUS|nr:unnamed protein product [Notodromas monacha]CAG0918546.1 unnamed protein product [Notodromas monacha]